MLAQVLFNGLIAGSTYALLGLSFGLIYMPTRFFHFAHGVVYAAGAYGTLAAISWLNLPLSIAVLVGVGTSTVIGLTIECTVYRALRRRSASSLVFLLTSLGLYIVLQNSISLFFGDYIQRLKDSYNPESLSRLMCLDQVTIDWKGRFYDCDFNLALDLPKGGWSGLDSYTENSGIGSKIFTDYHCLSCTAGSGSNCRGNFT